MWLLWVTTIASAVLADAGYLYNPPNAPARLSYHAPAHVPPPQILPPHNYRQQDVKTLQGIQEEDKSISYSISYKDYVYLKKENYNGFPFQVNQNYNNAQYHHGHVGGNGGSAPLQNNNNAGYSNNGYVGYTQPSTSPINVNNNYVHSYSRPASNVLSHHYNAPSTITHVGANTGYVNTNQLPSATVSYSNSYAQTQPVGVIHNTGYTQTAPAPGINNYNSYSQISAPSAPAVNLNNAYTQTSIPTGGTNLNNYVSTATSNGGYAHTVAPQSNTYSNTQANQVAQAPLNIGYNYNTPTAPSNDYSQITQINTPQNTGYNQAAQVNIPLNTGLNQGVISTAGDYSHNSPSYDANNGYVASSSASSNLNAAYDQSSSSPTNTNLNNGYGQNLAPTGSANLNTAYESSATSSSSAVNNNLAPISITTASGTSSTSFSDASTGPTHIDLNPGNVQPLASTGLDSGSTQTLTSASSNLNTGLVQSNFNTPVNPSPAAPPVTPIIHKHIYFHVPPPEIEEPQRIAPPPPPPKKNYKIIFIKVPSQESKSNLVRLQQQIEQMKSAVEEKTLVYVLVKNPEEPKPVVLPTPKPSEHQVYFVKYGGNPFDIASQVNDELDKTGTVKSIVSLEPGLVNGQHK